MPKKLYKNYFMETTFFFGIFLCLLNLGHALRCFDCQNISSPRDCTQITECNTNEQCFTEQILSHDGSLVFNIGCISNTRCSPMIFGKRSLSKRRNEITVCLECCANSFCNHHGCGEKEISLTQRGPYCFNCDAIIDPKECSNVTVCDKDELCMLTSPVQYANLPQTIYKSQCGSKQMCDVLTHLPSDPRCTSMRCGTDY
ncbi:uncharacterized protein LOC132749600, partial [Ruditapes philippinarum]|uniref:uncharacterized protein LOC132749600 n=1 Tax=Ruditapes philippinarum TaxID=129788 RepID=UPI00295B23E9